MALWIIRVLFLCLCTTGGLAVSQVRPEWLAHPLLGAAVGFGFGWIMIAIDEMLKGFSLRAFSATSFGLLLGTLVALLIDRSGLFGFAGRRLGAPLADSPLPLSWLRLHRHRSGHAQQQRGFLPHHPLRPLRAAK